MSASRLVSHIRALWDAVRADDEVHAKFPRGSRVSEYLRTVLRDDFDEAMRFKFLQWSTALRALPPGGLRDTSARISLSCAGGDDGRLPVAHTCPRIIDAAELQLPPSSCAAVHGRPQRLRGQRGRVPYALSVVCVFVWTQGPWRDITRRRSP
jgi:hypothetical protein